MISVQQENSMPVNVTQLTQQIQQRINAKKATIPTPNEMMQRHDQQLQELTEQFRQETLAEAQKTPYSLEAMIALMGTQKKQTITLVKQPEAEIDEYKLHHILSERLLPQNRPTLTITPELLNEVTEQYCDIFSSLHGTSHLNTQEYIILGDIGSALMVLADRPGLGWFKAKSENGHHYYNKAQCAEFLIKHLDTFYTLGLKFKQWVDLTEEQEEKDEFLQYSVHLKSLPLKLCSEYLPPELRDPADASPFINRNFILYQAQNGELALQFSSKAARDIFFQQHFADSAATIDTAYRQGPQFASNPEGKTPVIYRNNPKCIYIPSYTAMNGEFACNLGSSANASKLFQILFAHSTVTGEAAGADILRKGRSPSGTTLCTLYNNYSQRSTLYFDPKLFAQNKYLRVSFPNSGPVPDELDSFAQEALSQHRAAQGPTPQRRR
jgi:hypothetical protein